MKNKVINTFALIGLITVIAVACSSALSDDEVIVATNNGVNTTTNTGSTNTSVQSTNGRFAISCTPENRVNADTYCYIMDTRDGNIVQQVRM